MGRRQPECNLGISLRRGVNTMSMLVGAVPCTARVSLLECIIFGSTRSSGIHGGITLLPSKMESSHSIKLSSYFLLPKEQRLQTRRRPAEVAEQKFWRRQERVVGGSGGCV